MGYHRSELQPAVSPPCRRRAARRVTAVLLSRRACAEADEWDGALAVWQQMVRNDMRPPPAMYAVVLGACRRAGRADEANLLIGYAEREGVPLLAMDEAAGEAGEDGGADAGGGE